MKKSPVYTRSGDHGESGLVGGKRVPKTHPRLMAYGTLDELQALLGCAVAFGVSPKIKKIIIVLQNDIFTISSHLASEKPPAHLTAVTEEHVKKLEHFIDFLDAKLPPLKNFIIPGGSRTGSFLHLGRTVCRRAERMTIVLAQKMSVAGAILKYLNRLSDLLFVLARFENQEKRKKETIWKVT